MLRKCDLFVKMGNYFRFLTHKKHIFLKIFRVDCCYLVFWGKSWEFFLEKFRPFWEKNWNILGKMQSNFCHDLAQCKWTLFSHIYCNSRLYLYFTGKNLLRITIKVRKKCSFFMGIFTWLEPGLKNCWYDASILAINASSFSKTAIALHGNVLTGDLVRSGPNFTQHASTKTGIIFQNII